MASCGVMFRAMRASARETAYEGAHGARGVGCGGQALDDFRNVLVHEIGGRVLEAKQAIAQQRASAGERLHDTRTLSGGQFAFVAVLELLQCSTRQVVGVLLQHGLLRGLHLIERSLDGEHEVPG